MTRQTIFVNQETGEIKSWVSGRDLEFLEGDVYNGDLVLKLDSSVDVGSFRKTNYWKDGEWNSRSERPTLFYYWKDYSWKLNTEMLYREIRSRRNALLSVCDWTQTSDSPLSEEKKNEWKVYRQELRDLTELLTAEITDLGDVIWPTPPN